MSSRAPAVPPSTDARVIPWIAAALAMVYAVYGACWIVIHANPLISLALRLADVTDQSDVTLEKWSTIAVFGPILLLGLVGLLLFRVPPAIGRIGRGTLLAFLSGLAAVVVLVAVALASRVAMPAAKLFPSPRAGLFLAGSLLMAMQVVAGGVLFRGLVLRVVDHAGGWIVAIVASAIGFTIVHAFGDWTNPLSLANIFLAGIWFGLLAIRTGGLAAPIAAHFGYNWAEAMLFGAAPNPGVGAFGSMIDIDLAGKAVWGGSVEGFNASLVLTLILTLLIAGLLRGIGRTVPAKREVASAP